MDTRDFGGQDITKTIAVRTNDRRQPQILLTVKGRVDKLVTIAPTIAKLYGNAGEEVKSLIRIIPDEKYPFRITEAQSTENEHFSIELEEVKLDGRFAYQLKVVNRLTSKGRYFDTILLKTTSENIPEIKIRVFGKIS